jgi:hypothetical protein
MPQQAVWGKGFLESCLELVIDLKGKQKLYFYFTPSSKKILKSSAIKKEVRIRLLRAKKNIQLVTLSL